MKRILAAVVLLCLAVPAEARCILFLCYAPPPRHAHVRHYARHMSRIAFCQEVVQAFRNKTPPELGLYIAAIPQDKRAQASQCLEGGYEHN